MDQQTFTNGERKLIEMTAGRPENSRFCVCFWMLGDWYFDEGDCKMVKDKGYSIVAIHDLPPRTYQKDK